MEELSKFEKETLAMQASKELVELGVLERRNYVHVLTKILKDCGMNLNEEVLEERMNRKGWE